MGLYDTGDDISCLSKRQLKNIPFHLQPRPRPETTASCHMYFATLTSTSKLARRPQFTSFTSSATSLKRPSLELTYPSTPANILPRTKKFHMGNLTPLAVQNCQNHPWNTPRPAICHIHQSQPYCQTWLVVSLAPRPNVWYKSLVKANPTWMGAILGPPNEQGQVTFPIQKCAPFEIDLTRNDFIWILDHQQVWSPRKQQTQNTSKP